MRRSQSYQTMNNIVRAIVDHWSSDLFLYHMKIHVHIDVDGQPQGQHRKQPARKNPLVKVCKHATVNRLQQSSFESTYCCRSSRTRFFSFNIRKCPG